MVSCSSSHENSNTFPYVPVTTSSWYPDQQPSCVPTHHFKGKIIFLIIPTLFEKSFSPKKLQVTGPLIWLKCFIIFKDSLKTTQLPSYTNHPPVQIIWPIGLK